MPGPSIPLPVIPRTYRCALEWHDASYIQDAVNVLHIRSDNPADTAAGVYGALAASVSAAMWNIQVTSASILSVAITPLDGVSATQQFPTGGGAIWTGQAADTFAPAISNIIKLSTGLRGRAHRGRIFLPFVTYLESETQGVLPPIKVTLITNAWQAFQTALAAHLLGYEIGVASYDRAHSGAGATFTPATLVQCEAGLGTQRRRQTRVRKTL